MNPQHVGNIGGSRINPAIYALLVRNFFHDDANEVAAVVAFRHDLAVDFRGIQARDLKSLALEPFPHHRFFVLANAQVAVDGLEHIKNIHLSMKSGKSPGGKQKVIEKAGSGAWTANYKNWRFHGPRDRVAQGRD